jgi:hypothetical protein
MGVHALPLVACDYCTKTRPFIYCLLCLRVCVCVGVCQREMERGSYGDSMYLYFYQAMYEYYVTTYMQRICTHAGCC